MTDALLSSLLLLLPSELSWLLSVMDIALRENRRIIKREGGRGLCKNDSLHYLNLCLVP